MSGIEKVCECPKGDCEYRGWEMYICKRNSLQINPECRYQFKWLTAKCAIVAMYNSTSDFLTVRKPPSENSKVLHKGTYFKENGLYYNDDYDFTSLKDKAVKQYMQYGMRLFTKPYVAVWVEEHDKVYINWLDSVKNIRAFKRNMRKLFGYDIPIKTNLRFKQELSCDDLVRKMLEVNDV